MKSLYSLKVYPILYSMPLAPFNSYSGGSMKSKIKKITDENKLDALFLNELPLLDLNSLIGLCTLLKVSYAADSHLDTLLADCLLAYVQLPIPKKQILIYLLQEDRKSRKIKGIVNSINAAAQEKSHVNN
jgi:hypothetical protein